MDPVLDRFLRYVRVWTTADEHSDSIPSTARQLDLSRMLADECRAIGCRDVSLDDSGIVIATVPATVSHAAPAIAWVAHVDTSPEFSGKDVKPIVHANYDGRDIVLPGDPARVVTVAANPALKTLVGGTIVTTDGTTLLGADDKAGVAAIMTAAAELLADPSVPHGPVRLVFTTDEEIGRGVTYLDPVRLECVCGYTLDGDGSGQIDSETFSADQAVVTVTGINTHPSVGKGAMVNAVRTLARFLSELPTDRLAPETTDGRDGFIHPYEVSGGVAQATARLILRDFETEKLAEQAALLESIAERLRREEPRAKIDVAIRAQYRNMREGLAREPRALAKAVEATRAAGMEPELSIIRGGTDGSLLTAKGLPTPNISTGEHNPHSPLEWTSVEELRRAVQVLKELARLWGEERA